MLNGPGNYDWVFRVASSPRAGGGHVARCLNLATALADGGAQTIFVLDDDGCDSGADIEARGFAWRVASDMPGGRIRACVIDGYDYDDDMLSHWRQQATLVTALVDQLPIPTWADLILAPGFAPDNNFGAGRRVLAGLQYALIDPRHASGPKSITGKVKNILVSFGLRDSLNATRLSLQALDRLPDILNNDIAITVAMGVTAPHRDAIVAQVQSMQNAICKINADMTFCYAQADLAIGGGGVGMLERMARGLPSVSVVLAKNQARQIEICAQTGGTLNAGPIVHLDAGELATMIGPLLRSAQSRATMSARAREAIDGRGPARCARTMLELAFAS